MIISGFPGIGKSTLCQMLTDAANGSTASIIDSDSSTFDKTAFPANYLNHIQKAAPVYDYVLVSSHEAVRTGLIQIGIAYTLVYPSIDQKADYMARYAQRGSSQIFLDLMDREWDTFITSCSLNRASFVRHVELKSGQYLSDVIDKLKHISDLTRNAQ